MFRFDSSNALLGLVQQGKPRLQESQVDSKKTLENSLKRACQSLIDHMAHVAAGGLMAFLDLADMGSAAASSSSSLPPAPFDATKAAAVLDSVVTALDTALPTMLRKMGLYLQSSVTRAVLYKPVKAQVRSALGRFRLVVVNQTGPEAAALNDRLQTAVAKLEVLAVDQVEEKAGAGAAGIVEAGQEGKA